MSKIESAFFEVNLLERLSFQDTPVHRLDPRAKLITTLIFIFTVVSFGKYEVSGLLIFSLFPISIAIVGNISLTFLLKRLLFVAPFAFFIGIFNPIFDREILINIGSFGISGGWISFVSIMIRFSLTVSAALVFIAVSGFFEICLALEKLKVPKIFVIQLLFLYRYIFVLIDEALRLVRARTLRSFHGRGSGIRETGSLIGNLLIRTINRARQVHTAMLCRGFDGDIHLLRSISFKKRDFFFIITCSLFFIIVRVYNVPKILGNFILVF